MALTCLTDQLKGAVEKPVKLHFHFREQRSQSWRFLTQHPIQMDQFLLHNHAIGHFHVRVALDKKIKMHPILLKFSQYILNASYFHFLKLFHEYIKVFLEWANLK